MGEFEPGIDLIVSETFYPLMLFILNCLRVFAGIHKQEICCLDLHPRANCYDIVMVEKLWISNLKNALDVVLVKAMDIVMNCDSRTSEACDHGKVT